jgi:flagellar biosynthesis/type III secretory pathway protein FliH
LFAANPPISSQLRSLSLKLASELLHDATLVTKNIFLNTMKEVLAENTLSKGYVTEKKARKKPQNALRLGLAGALQL